MRSDARGPALRNGAPAPASPRARERPPPAEPPPPRPGTRDGARKRTSSPPRGGPSPRRGAWLFGLLVGAALYAGWAGHAERHLTPESGLGYALGIAGGVTMLLLLLYPLRKKVRGARWLGATKHWFRAHMAFGVLGPVMILFHANFGLGSTNSNVALVSMLLVVFSGFVGRYLYSRIHHGLYGRRASLAELRELARDSRSSLGGALSFAPQVQGHLDAFGAAVLEPPPGGAGGLLGLAVETRRAHAAARRALRRALREEARDRGWSARERRRRGREARRHLSAYFSAARRVAAFGLCERLFSLWHTFHLPLFALLLIASMVHIVAVHLY